MLNIVGYGMLVFGGIVIIVALIMMIVWKVPSIIDELSGRKAKRQIARMKKLGSSYKVKYSTSSDLNSNVTFSKNDVLGDDVVQLESGDLSSLVNNPISVSTDYIKVKSSKAVIKEKSNVISAESEEEILSDDSYGGTSFIGVKSSIEDKNTSFIGVNNDNKSNIEDENTSFIEGNLDSENTSFMGDNENISISDEDITTFTSEDDNGTSIIEEADIIGKSAGIKVLYEDISIDLLTEGII